ncbi:unnamed protein product [Caenorhabditis auriculariae]|uniref:Cystatin domain-containing protein n=1 Tax=Caenorhabditis auriculariae TaxID=2777116 RepID=A0A8S1HJC4_9PELO|nr:unnamed protein product [Caenorhabditis auriculariae]
MCSKKVFVLVAVAFFGLPEDVRACGSVDVIPVTTAGPSSTLASTTTMGPGRKRRSIVDVDDVSVITFITDVIFAEQSEEDVQKLVEEISSSVSEKDGAMTGAQYKVNSFEDNGKLAVRYTIQNASCQQVTKFASTAKFYAKFISVATVECNHEGQESA